MGPVRKGLQYLNHCKICLHIDHKILEIISVLEIISARSMSFVCDTIHFSKNLCCLGISTPELKTKYFSCNLSLKIHTYNLIRILWFDMK